MFTVGRSKTGLATFSESGGGSTNTGGATVLAGAHGEKLKPLFVPRGYSNGNHAIFVLRVGMYIVDAVHDRGGEQVNVYRVVGINADDTVEAELIAEYKNGDGNIPDFLESAADAALGKSHCYHCREPHYVARQ